jgi:hypothetical protein
MHMEAARSHDGDMTIQPSPATGYLRVSHADRDAVVERLQHAYGEGRLDETELDSRLNLAMTAKTETDLTPLLADLPAGRPAGPPMEPPEPAPDGTDRVLAASSHALGAVTLFVGPLVMLVVAGRRSPFVRRHALAALNFQLTLLLITLVTLGLGGVVYSIAWLICAIAALLALVGSRASYPFRFRLVR